MDDVPTRIAALQAQFQHFADLHPWLAMAIPTLGPRCGMPRIGVAYGPPVQPSADCLGVVMPDQAALHRVVEHVETLTHQAGALLLEAVNGAHSIPADTAQDIRDAEAVCPGFGWVTWLRFAVAYQYRHRLHNYAQAAATALSTLTDLSRPANPFPELLAFAEKHLVGKQRTVIEKVCANAGKMPLADLALVCEWDEPSKCFDNIRRVLVDKLRQKRLPFFLGCRGGVVTIQRKPNSPAPSKNPQT